MSVSSCADACRTETARRKSLLPTVDEAANAKMRTRKAKCECVLGEQELEDWTEK